MHGLIRRAGCALPNWDRTWKEGAPVWTSITGLSFYRKLLCAKHPPLAPTLLSHAPSSPARTLRPLLTLPLFAPPPPFRSKSKMFIIEKAHPSMKSGATPPPLTLPLFALPPLQVQVQDVCHREG